MKPIDSPCVRNCCLDENDICLGCFRSLSEITRWSLVDNDTKKEFLKNALDRRKQSKYMRFGQ
ncbi:MAG: DUF1289 domain-containing protein [Methylococcaceae bacterium]|jgi:hypothetical protein